MRFPGLFVSCSVDTGRALAEAGLHPASEGDGSLLCSGDMLLGSEEQMAALRADDEFQRINTRASLIIDELGVVDAVLGDGIAEQIGTYREAIDDLA